MPSDVLLIGQRVLEKEANSLLQFSKLIDDRFEKACKLIFNCKGSVVLTGMGKSGLVARKWASTFASTGTRAFFINPAEARHGDLGMLGEKDLLIALTLSGETDELYNVISHAKELGQVIVVSKEEKSTLAKKADLILPIILDKEACPLGLAPTTSTTLMMALGDALSMTVMQMRGFSEDDFAKLHPGGSLGRVLLLRVKELMHQGEEIPFVTPSSSFQDVLIEMTTKRLGLAIVKEQKSVLGIITDGDLRRFLQKGSWNKATAKDMMTVQPKTLSENQLAIEAKEMMKQNSIQHLLVLDGNKELVGVLSLYDLLKVKIA